MYIAQRYLRYRMHYTGMHSVVSTMLRFYGFVAVICPSTLLSTSVVVAAIAADQHQCVLDDYSNRVSLIQMLPSSSKLSPITKPTPSAQHFECGNSTGAIGPLGGINWAKFGTDSVQDVGWEDLMDKDEIQGAQFVVLGANDGVVYANCVKKKSPFCEPVANYVRKYDWQGVFLEPVPDTFQRLVSNYEGLPGIEFLNFAVGLETKKITIHYQPGYNTMATTDTQHAHEIERMKLPNGEMKELSIQAFSLEDLWHRLQPRKIDVLALDIEGLDYKLLMSNNLAALKPTPRFLMTEFLKISRQDQEKLIAHLGRAGYKPIRCVNDVDAIFKLVEN